MSRSDVRSRLLRQCPGPPSPRCIHPASSDIYRLLSIDPRGCRSSYPLRVNIRKGLSDGRCPVYPWLPATVLPDIAERTYRSSIPTGRVRSLPGVPWCFYLHPSTKGRSDRSCNRYRLHYPVTRKSDSDSSCYVRTCWSCGPYVLSAIRGCFLTYRLFSGRSTYRGFRCLLHHIHKVRIRRITHRSGGPADNGIGGPYSGYVVSSIRNLCASALRSYSDR